MFPSLCACQSMIFVFVRQRDSLDEAFVTEVLLDRMKDDVPEVVAAALKALEVSTTFNTINNTVSVTLGAAKGIYFRSLDRGFYDQRVAGESNSYL